MKKGWTAWIICLVIIIATNIVNIWLFSIPHMIKLELTPDPASMQYYIDIIAKTPAQPYEILFRNTLVDYAFLVGYSLLAFYSFKILLGVFDAHVNIGIYLLSWITGLLDIMENNFLLSSALRNREEFSQYITIS